MAFSLNGGVISANLLRKIKNMFTKDSKLRKGDECEDA
jgi:hypothetical protein